MVWGLWFRAVRTVGHGEYIDGLAVVLEPAPASQVHVLVDLREEEGLARATQPHGGTIRCELCVVGEACCQTARDFGIYRIRTHFYCATHGVGCTM